MIEINLQKLEKGTKLEWRTVTRDGKTFKQRFRVGMKESSPEEKMRAYEDTIKEQLYETSTAFSEKGDVVFTKDGEENCVKFTKEERDKLKGLRFTHNHPKGSGFSPADLHFACEAEMKELRVVSKTDGTRYSFSLKDGSNFSHDLWINKLKLTHDKYNNEINREFNAKIYDGRMTIEQANKEHFPKLWDLVARDIPELKYKVS